MISPTSTNEKVTVDDGKRKDYVFRACFIDPFQGPVMAKFALNNLKAKTAAVSTTTPTTTPRAWPSSSRTPSRRAAARSSTSSPTARTTSTSRPS